jgi:hypothetical protein
MDLPTQGTKPISKQHGSTAQEETDLANLRCLGRTVRMDQADCPWGPGGLSRVHCGLSEIASRTTNTALQKTPFVPYPRTVYEDKTIRTHLADRPTNLEQPKAPDKTD